MKIQNIIFDLGGVLIEWNPLDVISRFSPDPDVQSILMQGIFEHPDWAEKDRGGFTEAEGIHRSAHRTGFSVEKITSLMVAIRDSLTLMADTLPLIDEFRSQGYPIYCLSNMPVEHYQHLKQLYDFWDRFDGIVISGMVKMVKPEPEIYQYLLSKYQLEPSTCVFIDDSPKNIEVARSLGINGIIFTNVHSCRLELREMLKNEGEGNSSIDLNG